MPMFLQGRALPNHQRPFTDWLADAQRQCTRRTGQPLFANGAPERYWMSAYRCGLTAWEAADAFIQEQR